MNQMSDPNANPNPTPPEKSGSTPEDDIFGKPHWTETVSKSLVIGGFIAILLAGLCFYLYRNHPLQYDDFVIDANQLGKYLLMAGALSYFLGRIIFYRSRVGKGRSRRG